MENAGPFVAGTIAAAVAVIVPVGTHLAVRRRWSRVLVWAAAAVFLLWLGAWTAAAYGAVYVSDCDTCDPPESAFGSAVWLVLILGGAALVGLAVVALAGALGTALRTLRR